MEISIETFIIWLVISLLVGFLGELLSRRRNPLGIIGAAITGFIAIILIVGVFRFSIAGEPRLAGVPIISSVLASALLVTLWSAFTYPRYYRH